VAYIVNGNRTDTKAKEEFASRLDDMISLVLTHSYSQNGCKGTKKF
jgi:hypothetical protein